MWMSFLYGEKRTKDFSHTFTIEQCLVILALYQSPTRRALKIVQPTCLRVDTGFSRVTNSYSHIHTHIKNQNRANTLSNIYNTINKMSRWRLNLAETPHQIAPLRWCVCVCTFSNVEQSRSSSSRSIARNTCGVKRRHVIWNQLNSIHSSATIVVRDRVSVYMYVQRNWIWSCWTNSSRSWKQHVHSSTTCPEVVAIDRER